MRILLTGSNGLLGQKIVNQLNKKRVDYLATSSGENRHSKCSNYQSLDITDKEAVFSVVGAYQPTHVINTAAMTNVDLCEDQPDQCHLVNVQAVEYLFQACQNINAYFVHLSTDFVFDGTKGNYEETDERAPQSVYAKSKYDSENILMQSTYKKWAILRTIIVYGQGEALSRNNIVVWAKHSLLDGQTLTIVDDQFRAPTWADDLAWACVKAAELEVEGVFHISGPETMSVYELVSRIAQFYKLDPMQVKAIKTATLNQKAPRPPKTGFNLSKSRKILGYSPKTIEETLELID